MKTPVVKYLALLLVCGAASACTDLGFGVRTPTELERAIFEWERSRPEGYVFAVERLCFCPDWGPVRVTVQGDAVVERVFVDTGDPVPESLAGAYPTVDGLLELLVAAYEGDADHIQATYDPATGVPVEFWIDYSEMMADEELGMRVTEPVTDLAP